MRVRYGFIFGQRLRTAHIEKWDSGRSWCGKLLADFTPTREGYRLCKTCLRRLQNFVFDVNEILEKVMDD